MINPLPGSKMLSSSPSNPVDLAKHLQPPLQAVPPAFPRPGLCVAILVPDPGGDLSKPFAQPSFEAGIGCRPKKYISTERSERLWNPHPAATQTAKLLQQIGTVAFADYQLHSHGLGALGPNPRFWNALCRNPRYKAIPLNPNLSIPRKKLSKVKIFGHGRDGNVVSFRMD